MTPDRYETTGVIRNGQLSLRHREAFTTAMRMMGDRDVVIVTVRTSHATRSIESNKLYWAGYVAPLAEYTGYDPHWIHAYLKKRFLTPNHLVIADANGVVIDEADLEPSTTRLTPQEFSAYLQRVAEFAIELGVNVGARERESA